MRPSLTSLQGQHRRVQGHSQDVAADMTYPPGSDLLYWSSGGCVRL